MSINQPSSQCVIKNGELFLVYCEQLECIFASKIEDAKHFECYQDTKDYIIEHKLKVCFIESV